jgi:hypothetical protein
VFPLIRLQYGAGSARVRRNGVVRVVVLAALIAVIPAQPSFAYVDPNSCGLFYQMLMPLVAIVSTGYALLKRRIYAGINLLIRRYYRNRKRSDDMLSE